MWPPKSIILSKDSNNYEFIFFTSSLTITIKKQDNFIHISTLSKHLVSKSENVDSFKTWKCFYDDLQTGNRKKNVFLKWEFVYNIRENI